MAFTDWIADEQLDEVEIEEDVTSEEASEVEEAIEEQIVGGSTTRRGCSPYATNI